MKNYVLSDFWKNNCNICTYVSTESRSMNCSLSVSVSKPIYQTISYTPIFIKSPRFSCWCSIYWAPLFVGEFYTWLWNVQCFNEPRSCQSYRMWWNESRIVPVQVLVSFQQVYKYNIISFLQTGQFILLCRDKNLVMIYRSLTLFILCNVSKVLKRIICDKIINFVSIYISPLQFSALMNRSKPATIVDPYGWNWCHLHIWI